MSRVITKLSENVTLITGTDVAVGAFVQITDKRFAESGKDPQGEGYVFDSDDMFTVTLDLIGIAGRIDVSAQLVVELCDKFAASGFEVTEPANALNKILSVPVFSRN